MLMRYGAFIFAFFGLFLLLEVKVAEAYLLPHERRDDNIRLLGFIKQVKAVETYLNSISTLRAHFVQTTSDGKQVDGTFMLKRPGRMRFDYAPPLTDFIVADGSFITYYDGRMKQQSNVSIDKSLAGFFLRPNLKFSGDIRVSGVKRDNGILRVTLIQSGDPLAGSMTLVLTENPMQLKKWIVVDAQELVTKVALSNVESGVKFDDDIFHYYDPELKNTFYNKD